MDSGWLERLVRPRIGARRSNVLNNLPMAIAPQNENDYVLPASDQIRIRSARPSAGDAEPGSDHGYEVHGDGGKDTHNQPTMNTRLSNIRTTFLTCRA
jgi:hypothetical protein